MPDHPDSPANGRRRDRLLASISPIVPGRSGRPSFSLKALRELIEAQFTAETAAREDILQELASPAQRRALLAEIADYILALEAITLSAADRHRLLDLAYRSLFGFGPLDELLHDPAITEITVEGPATIHARRGLGPLEPVQAAFADGEHLATILQRVLGSAGIALSGPFLETGLRLHGRRLRLSVIGPPVRTDYSLELRLHPPQPLALADLAAQGPVLPPEALTLLQAILAARQGLVIVADVGLGKTTLAGALLPLLATLSASPTIAVVERAAELPLPPGVAHHLPPSGTPGDAFAAAIVAALETRPAWLVIDELRGAAQAAEAAAVWQALTCADPPAYLWVFRGARQPERLRNALSILIRQDQQALPQADIHRALAERLPFVLTLKRGGDRPRLDAIAAWHLDPADPERLALIPLLADRDGAWTLTSARPSCALDLPETFWSAAGHDPVTPPA